VEAQAAGGGGELVDGVVEGQEALDFAALGESQQGTAGEGDVAGLDAEAGGLVCGDGEGGQGIGGRDLEGAGDFGFEVATGLEGGVAEVDGQSDARDAELAADRAAELPALKVEGEFAPGLFDGEAAGELDVGGGEQVGEGARLAVVEDG